MQIQLMIVDDGSYTELAKASATIYDKNGYVTDVLYCEVGPGATTSRVAVTLMDGGRAELVQAFPPMVVDEDQMAAVPGEWPDSSQEAKTKKLAVAADPKHADHARHVEVTKTPVTKK